MSLLADKVCLVTGAANGLGAASAIGLADAGARVVLCDRDADGLRVTGERIAARWGADRVRTATADVSVESDVVDAVRLATEAFGHIDVLLNNAGTGAQIVRRDFISVPLKSWDVSVEQWRRIIEINAIAPFAFARLVIPGMVERGWGRIINVSTTWETMLRPGFASYGPSKAALESMAHAMARELKGSGVTVNNVHPGGPVDTAQVPDDIGVPRGQLLRPDVMVRVLVWLCSVQADAVTGHRFTAALWPATLSDPEAIAAATESLAWPQLVRPIVMTTRGRLAEEARD